MNFDSEEKLDFRGIAQDADDFIDNSDSTDFTASPPWPFQNLRARMMNRGDDDDDSSNFPPLGCFEIGRKPEASHSFKPKLRSRSKREDLNPMATHDLELERVELEKPHQVLIPLNSRFLLTFLTKMSAL